MRHSGLGGGATSARVPLGHLIQQVGQSHEPAKVALEMSKARGLRQVSAVNEQSLTLVALRATRSDVWRYRST